MGYLDGFGVTIKKWLGPGTDSGRRVTLQYPEQTRPKPERFHGRHVLNRYDDGMEKCIGCELCAGVCPAKCIYVRGRDNDPEDPTSPGERYGFIYEINYLRCIHCDLCVEACPTEAITETKLFEFAFTNRADAIYTKAELVVGDDGRPQQLPWENWDGGFDPAQDASGWMRATAPGGDADFVGIVAWAGELGYGVRAPEGGGTVPAQVADELVATEPAATEPATAEPAPRVATSEPDAAPVAPASFDAPEPEAPVQPDAARPLLVDAPESLEPPTPDAGTEPDAAPTRRAGLFDAPDADAPAGRRTEPSTAPTTDEPVDTSIEDARVAEAVEAAFADAPAEADEGAAAPADEATAPDDEPPAEPPAPAAPSGGPGFFDLPDAPAEEPEPKRRRRGWGRR